MKSSVFYVFSALLFVSTACFAEQDFYGIQMKNELWAQNLVLGSGPAADPRDLSQGPVLNHAVHAEASLKSAADEHLDFRVNIINDSDSEISTDYRYRDFFIYTKDGRKFPLIDDNDDSRYNTIAPKSSKMFTPTLGNLRLQNEEVRMVSCSFDLGRTEIFLFPWSKKDQINQLTNPAPQAQEAAPPMLARRPSKVKPPQKGGARNGFMEWLGLKKSQNEKPAAALPPPVRSVEAVPQNAVSISSSAPASSRENLDRAIKNFVYTPTAVTSSDSQAAPSSMSVSAARTAAVPVAAAGATRSEAHVIGYDKANNFVTMNLGFKDGLRQNMTISILHDGKTVAKAKVKQLRDNVAAAILMPGISKTEVRPGDKISLV